AFREVAGGREVLGEGQGRTSGIYVRQGRDDEEAPALRAVGSVDRGYIDGKPVKRLGIKEERLTHKALLLFFGRLLTNRHFRGIDNLLTSFGRDWIVATLTCPQRFDTYQCRYRS